MDNINTELKPAIKADDIKNKFKNLSSTPAAAVQEQPAEVKTVPNAAVVDKKASEIQAIKDRAKDLQKHYSSVGDQRAENDKQEIATDKSNKEQFKRTSVYMSFDEFTQFQELKARCTRQRVKLTYTTLVRYAMDSISKKDNADLGNELNKYNNV